MAPGRCLWPGHFAATPPFTPPSPAIPRRERASFVGGLRFALRSPTLQLTTRTWVSKGAGMRRSLIAGLVPVLGLGLGLFGCGEGSDDVVDGSDPVARAEYAL